MQDVFEIKKIVGHVAEDGLAEKIDGGFKLGQWVKVINRFTVKFEYKENNGLGELVEMRKDICIGEEMLIVGCAPDKKGMVHPICLIKKDINENLTASGEFQIKSANVEPSSKANVDPAAGKDAKDNGKAKPPKALEWMQDEPIGTEFHHHKKWVAKLPDKDEENNVTQTKFQVGFTMNAVVGEMPTYKDEDFTFVQTKLNGKMSEPRVYTGRDFKANEIVFVADATEIRQRSYTLTKQVLIGDGHLLNHQKKHITVDGRLRSVPSDVRCFAPFFAVERADEKTNMVIQNAETNIQVDVTMPWKKTKNVVSYKKGATAGENASCGIPVMYNPKPIKKNTRLFVGQDAELQRLQADDEKAKKRKIDAAAKENAKKAKCGK